MAALICLAAAGCSGDDGDDPTAFCESMRAATALTSAVSELDLDDQRVVELAIGDLDNIRADAPDEIAEATTAVADAWAEILRTLSATAPGARPDRLREMQPQLDAVAGDTEALNRYAETACGIRFQGPAAPTPTPTPLDIED